MYLKYCTCAITFSKRTVHYMLYFTFYACFHVKSSWPIRQQIKVVKFIVSKQLYSIGSHGILRKEVIQKFDTLLIIHIHRRTWVMKMFDNLVRYLSCTVVFSFHNVPSWNHLTLLSSHLYFSPPGRHFHFWTNPGANYRQDKSQRPVRSEMKNYMLCRLNLISEFVL